MNGDWAETVAIYGPKRPDRSGVASYVDAMIAHAPANLRLIHVGNDDWQDPRRFKHVLYQIGASKLHHGTFQAIRLRAGPAIIHEYNVLSYFYEAWDLLPTEQQAELLALVEKRLGRPFADLDEMLAFLDGHPGYDRYSVDVEIERLFADRLNPILVHSQHAERRLRRLAGTSAVHRIPLMAYPLEAAGRARARRRLGLAESEFLFGTYGFIGSYKRVDRIVMAWLEWSDRPTAARLLILGQQQDPVEIPSRSDIFRIDYVEDEAEFLDFLAASDCAIQLRHPSLGEMSGVASACMANGIPLIVSDTPETHEFAFGAAVQRVRPDASEIGSLIAAMRNVSNAPRGARHYDQAYHPRDCTRLILERIGALAAEDHEEGERR